MTDGFDGPTTLRLVWPQWQGATRANVEHLLPDVPVSDARHGYATGSRVLQAVLPDHAGPTEIVPVDMVESGEGSTNGVESRGAVVQSLIAALDAIRRHDVDRVLTLGGECSVSVAPFATLAAAYGDDLAVVWIDSHPDCDTPDTAYDGYHAMAVSTLIGRGDQGIVELLPATVEPSRVALTGLHSWEPDAYPHIAEWGLTAFSPDDLRTTSQPLVEWLASTGATKVAIHLDVDAIDSDEVALGLGKEPGGLSREQVRRVIADVSTVSDVVGLTIAEFIPRDVLAIQGLLRGLPPIPVDPDAG